MKKQKINRKQDIQGYITAEQLIEQITSLSEDKGIPLDQIIFDQETYYEYGSEYARAYLSYSEEETDAEVTARIKREEERQQRRDESDRAKFEELKKRFG